MRKKIFENIGFLLPIIIIFSSLKTFGYVITFFFYIPYLINNRHKVLYGLKKSKFSEKQVFLFFSFIIIQIIHGTYFIQDIRISLFWIPLIIVSMASYFKNLSDLITNTYYKKNYFSIIYKSCVVYFIFYFIMNCLSYFIYGYGFYKVQDYFWIGSSGAFAISSILFYTMSKLWEENKFRIFSSYTFFYIFYIFLVLLNESRLGLIYISFFLFYLIIKNIQIKQYLNIFLITSIVFSSYSLSSIVIGEFHVKFSSSYGDTNYNIKRNIVGDTKNILKGDKRNDLLLKGINKFKEYPNLNKLIGTGWYSSRITINLDSSEIKPLDFKNKKIIWPPAILAYILDTGLIGVILALYIFTINVILIIHSKEDLVNKLFILSLLGITVLNVFIGYPFVNLAYILFLLPFGIIQEKNIYKF